MCCQQHAPVQNEVAYEYFGDRFSVTAERTYKQVYTAIQYVFILTACANTCDCASACGLTAHLSLLNRTSESLRLCIAPVSGFIF